MEEQMRRENGDDGRRTKEEDDEQEKKPEMSSEESGGNENPQPPPVMAFNHACRLCRDAEASFHFYANVLGFVPVKRPQAFNFDGAWFNYGVGIHLVQKEQQLGEAPDTEHLDPMDNHISFQCEDLDAMERKMKKMNIKYIKRTVKDEQGQAIDQLFFKDPDGNMIEIDMQV